MVSLQESDLQLLILAFYLGWHHQLSVRIVRLALDIEGNLRVSNAHYIDRHLEVTSDLVEVFTLWVNESEPLMLDSVPIHEVNLGQVE
jgi:hypothetical protein